MLCVWVHAVAHSIELISDLFSHSMNPIEESAGAEKEKPKMKCPISGCEQTFDNSMDKQTHLFAAHPEKIKYCPVCKRPFTSEKLLFTHMKTSHDDGPLHKCQFCEKEYALEESLSYHCDEEHEDEDVGPREFICPVSNCLKR